MGLPAGSDDAETTAGELVVDHVPQDSKFRISGPHGGHDISVVEYDEGPGVWNLHHTWTEPSRRGQGLADRVTRAAMDAARAAGVRVLPTCSYAAEWLADHPEYGDLVGRQE